MQTRFLSITVLLLSGSVLTATGAIYYVDGDNGSDVNNGTGWGNAFETLTFALSVATADDEIWVRAGVYRPTDDTDRTKSFEMKDGVDLYGGFAGTETERWQRDWTNNVTILCGDIGVEDDPIDNSYNVVRGANARLDGFTIRNGYADGGSLATYSGGGLYGVNINAMITANCIFTNNHARGTSHLTRGGAVYFGGTGDPDSRWINNVFVDNFAQRGGAVSADAPLGTFENCLFIRNRGGTGGAGAVELRANASVPVMGVFSNCIFRSNDCSSSYGNGGAILAASPGVFLHCWFEDNFPRNDRDGGAIYWVTGSQTGLIDHCVFINNVGARYGGAIALGSGGLTVSNSLFSANRSTGTGGTIYIFGATAALTLVGTEFVYNTTGAIGGHGAAISQNSGRLTIDGSIFASNSIPGQDARGGALYLVGGETLIADSFFIGNQTRGNRSVPGGAVYSGPNAAPVAIGCTFIENSIEDGYLGGDQSAGGAWLSEGPAVIRRCVFVGNTAKNSAANRGGALAFRNVTSGTAQVINSLFRENTGRMGGAVFVGADSQVVLSNVTAVANISQNISYGGALGNLDTDPLFADGIYLHLLSTTAYYDGGYFSGGEWLRATLQSPLIDAGDPASPWDLEPHPHYGERINMGAYGNTEVASRSRVPLGTLIMVR